MPAQAIAAPARPDDAAEWRFTGSAHPTITHWTGHRMALLQRALRMTTEGFADRLGVAARTVAEWRDHPYVQPAAFNEELLDSALAVAPEDVLRRFAMLLDETDRANRGSFLEEWGFGPLAYSGGPPAAPAGVAEDGPRTRVTQRRVPRPPRYNFAGYCVWCDEYRCTSASCAEGYGRSTWATCDFCGGSGKSEQCGVAVCTQCIYGAVEVFEDPDDMEPPATVAPASAGLVR